MVDRGRRLKSFNFVIIFWKWFDWFLYDLIFSLVMFVYCK